MCDAVARELWYRRAVLMGSQMSPDQDKEELSPSSRAPEEPLPILATCRARALGAITEFAECLAPEPSRCSHGLPFGDSRFCWHPRRQEIITRTSQAGAP